MEQNSSHEISDLTSQMAKTDLKGKSPMKIITISSSATNKGLSQFKNALIGQYFTVKPTTAFNMYHDARNTIWKELEDFSVKYHDEKQFMFNFANNKYYNFVKNRDSWIIEGSLLLLK